MSMGMHSRTNGEAGGDGVDKFLELYSSCSMHVRLNSLSDYAEI